MKEVKIKNSKKKIKKFISALGREVDIHNVKEMCRFHNDDFYAWYLLGA